LPEHVHSASRDLADVLGMVIRRRAGPPRQRRLISDHAEHGPAGIGRADCIKLLLAKPIKQISLYDIVTEPQPIFDRPVLSPADAAEIAMRKDFPRA
jgi:hypothetical protein